MLKSLGLTTNEINKAIGDMLRSPWEVISDPGGPEYPGGNVWNSCHAQESTAESGNALHRFIAQAVRHSPGQMIPFSDFYARFILWLPTAERGDWSKIRASRELPDKHPSRKGTANKAFVLNAVWE
jgi:hypothetical protein